MWRLSTHAHSTGSITTCEPTIFFFFCLSTSRSPWAVYSFTLGQRGTYCHLSPFTFTLPETYDINSPIELSPFFVSLFREVSPILHFRQRLCVMCLYSRPLYRKLIMISPYKNSFHFYPECLFARIQGDWTVCGHCYKPGRVMRFCSSLSPHFFPYKVFSMLFSLIHFEEHLRISHFFTVHISTCVLFSALKTSYYPNWLYLHIAWSVIYFLLASRYFKLSSCDGLLTFTHTGSLILRSSATMNKLCYLLFSLSVNI